MQGGWWGGSFIKVKCYRLFLLVGFAGQEFVVLPLGVVAEMTAAACGAF